MEEVAILHVDKHCAKKSVNIIAIADTHIGHPASRINELFEFFQSLKSQDFIIMLGDIVDNPDEKTGLYDTEKPPEEAYMEFSNLLAKFKKNILCLVSGNHEYRTKKRAGVDVLNIICTEKEIPYSPSIAVISIHLQDTTYKIAIGHGYSLSRTLGAKVNMMGELTKVIRNADVYIVGHTHQPSIVPIASFEIERGQIIQKQSLLVTAPCWTNYTVYAAQKFMPPSPLGYITIELHSDGSIVPSLKMKRRV